MKVKSTRSVVKGVSLLHRMHCSRGGWGSWLSSWKASSLANTWNCDIMWHQEFLWLHKAPRAASRPRPQTKPRKVRAEAGVSCTHYEWLTSHNRLGQSEQTGLYSIVISIKDVVGVLLTTGIGSCRTFGCDSARSLVFRSQRAPSKKRPWMYTPVNKRQSGFRPLPSTNSTQPTDQEEPWEDPGSSQHHQSLVTQAEMTFSDSMWSLLLKRVGSSLSVSHSQMHKHTVRLVVWQPGQSCECDGAPAGHWLRGRLWLRVSQMSWRHSEGLMQASVQTRGGGGGGGFSALTPDSLYSPPLSFPVSLVSLLIRFSSSTHCWCASFLFLSVLKPSDVSIPLKVLHLFSYSFFSAVIKLVDGLLDISFQQLS